MAKETSLWRELEREPDNFTMVDTSHNRDTRSVLCTIGRWSLKELSVEPRVGARLNDMVD